MSKAKPEHRLRFAKRAHSVRQLPEHDGDAVSHDQHDTVLFPYEPRLIPAVEQTKKSGMDVIHDPGLNKVRYRGTQKNRPWRPRPRSLIYASDIGTCISPDVKTMALNDFAADIYP